jgi:hypothetical protein
MNSLRTIILVALLARLIAVFFAPGYLMHDDHFLTVEPASSWADGQNFNNWKPGVDNDRVHPEPISFFYPGALSGVFTVLQALGIDDPSVQMVWMRLLHALWSLITVYFAVRIVRMIADEKSALTTGWLLALIGVLPNFAVRNLVEMVCQPFLLGGLFLLIRYGAMRSFEFAGMSFHHHADRRDIPWLHLIAAALIMGLAVGVRYQTVLIVALTGAVLLLQGSWLRMTVFGAISFFAFFLTQIDDVLLWGGQPFQHLTGYFEYNKENAGNYPGAPLAYLSFIGYFILPPVSVMLLWGFVRTWKKYLLLFLPAAGFLLFHILYPNRQERFILPALPLFVMLGVIGWNEWVNSSSFWQQRRGLHRTLWRIFWVINTLVLLVFATTYSKRSRVEAMHFLYNQGNCINFIHEFTHADGRAQLPRHYANLWVSYYPMNNATDVEYLVSVMPRNAEQKAHRLEKQPVPNYILFVDDTDLDQRVERLRTHFPTLQKRATIEPGWFDLLLNRINPLNKVERIHIYEMK